MKKFSFTLVFVATTCLFSNAQDWNRKDLSSMDIGNVQSIFFSSKDIGVLVSTKREGNQNTAYVLRTENGGNTWSIVNSSDVTTYSDIHFFDEMNGLIIGHHEDFGIGSWICATSDAGLTWDCNFINGSQDHSTELLFVNDSVGFAIGGNSDRQLIRTKDKGQTWEVFSLYQSYGIAQGIDFPAESIGFLAEAFYQPDGLTPYGGNLYKTDNNGDNWDLIYQDTTQPFSKLKFFDEMTGLLFNDSPNLVSWNTATKIMRTDDGGSTWQTVLTTPLLQEVTDVFEAQDGVVYAIGNGNVQTGGVILKSMNYGQNWTSSFIAPHNSFTLNKAHHDRFRSRLLVTTYNGYYTLENVLTSTKAPNIQPSEVHLFPNPAHGFLNVSVEENKDWLLSLFNCYGQLAFSTPIKANNQAIDLHHLPSGSYFARMVNSGGQVVCKKIVVSQN